jgi:hypothetical protein
MPDDYQINLIQPPGYVHSLCFNEIAKLLQYSFESLGYDCPIKINQLDEDKINIVLGYHLIDYKKSLKKYKYIPYQLEQISANNGWYAKSKDQTENYYKILSNAQSIWDYSIENIEFLKSMGLKATHLPIGYHPKLEVIQPAAVKDIDVFFYGSMNERRRYIVDRMKRMMPLRNIIQVFAVYGEERDKYIARSKIVLNIHYYESKVMEVVRLSYLLNNKCFVISEESNINPYDALNIVAVPYNDLIKTCSHYLEHPEEMELKETDNYSKYKEGHSMPEFLRKVVQNSGK